MINSLTSNEHSEKPRFGTDLAADHPTPRAIDNASTPGLTSTVASGPVPGLAP